jgi:hypothetical protein
MIYAMNVLRLIPCSPRLLSCKAFVEQVEDFCDVELDVFEVEVFLIVFLHLKKIVQLEVEF